MQLNHVGIINKNEEQALKFYQDFLGLKKTREILLPPELSEQLFSTSKEIKVLVVEKWGDKDLGVHIAIMVDSLLEITEKAKQFNADVIIGKHKDKTVYFLKDFSGNLIAVEQKP